MAKTQLLGAAAAVALLSAGIAAGDEFTKKDTTRWQEQYMQVVKEGRSLFTSPELGNNGVACAQCHPNAANTHPETYPKYQQQLGKVVPMREMINWCIMNPLEGEALALDSKKMTAIEAYISHERRGVALDPGKH